RRAAPRESARRGRRRPGASRWRLGCRRARAAPRSHLSLLLLPGFRRRSGGGQAVDGEVADPLGRGQGGDGGQWGEAPVVQGAEGLLAGRPGGEGDVPPGGDGVAGVGVGDPGELVHRAVPFSPGSLWCVLSCALVLRTTLAVLDEMRNSVAVLSSVWRARKIHLMSSPRALVDTDGQRRRTKRHEAPW